MTLHPHYHTYYRDSKGKDHRVKVLLSGDYEFLCHMYGLSGASGKHKESLFLEPEHYYLGRHNCLWCLIKSEALKEPRGQRTESNPKRSLKGIKDDNLRFLADGAIHKRAKEFNNVMAAHFFEIEIEEVHTLYYHTQNA